MKAPEDARIWIGGGVAATVGILAAAWLLLISPELATVPAQQDEVASAQVANTVLEAKVATLKAQSRDMPALIAELRTVRTQLPITADLPGVLDLLGAQARKTKVSITSLSIGSVTAVTAVTGTAATTTSGTDSTDTGGSAATASASPSASSGTLGSTTTSTGVTAVTGPAGQLFQIQLTVITSGSLARQEGFLHEVQYGGARAALVSSTQLAAGAQSESSAIGAAATLTTMIDVFVAPQTPAAAAALAKQLSTRSLQ